MGRAKLMALMLSLPLLAGAHWLEKNDQEVAAGREAYDKGDFVISVDSFRRALEGKGDPSALHFNLGTALVERALRQEDPTKRDQSLIMAIASLRRAAATLDPGLRESARYNLANALLLRGLHAEAISSYRAVLMENADHDDARHNLELALLASRAEVEGTPPVLALAGEETGETAAGIAVIGQSDPGGQDARSPGEPSSEQALIGEGEPSPTAAQPGAEKNSVGGVGAEEEGVSEEASNESRKRNADAKAESAISLQKKLDAMERRSAEMRRAMIFRKTTERVRAPETKGPRK